MCPIFEACIVARLKPYIPLITLLAGILTSYIVLHAVYNLFNLPYIWDELGVYSRAAIYLYENSLSLMPDAIPDELSRGHPTLTPFYFAIWFKLFGCKPLVAHVAAAFLNTAAFVFVYLILKKYINVWLSAAATFMIFLQPFILAQSTLVLPEMPLFFATTASVYFFLSDKNWTASVFLILALQIKESALILPLAFYISHLWVKRKFELMPLLQLLILPVLSFVVFILIQNFQRGYYFYPLHTSLLAFDGYHIEHRWHEFRDFLLWEQMHYILLLAWFIYVASFRGFKSINWRQTSVIFPVIFVGGVCFSVLNYYLSRYTIFFMVPLYCFLIISADAVANTKKSHVFSLLLIGIGIITALLNMKGSKDFKDTDFSYTNHAINMQSTITALDSSVYTGRTLRLDFPLAACYWGNKNGYVRKADYSITNDKNHYAEFAVFTYPGNMSDTSTLSANAKLVQSISNGYAYARIYRLLEEKDYR